MTTTHHTETAVIYCDADDVRVIEGSDTEEEIMESQTAAEYTCRCGELDGSEHCYWHGDISELVLVEYMPYYLRDTHAAARNSGAWPTNGSVRVAIHFECAQRLVEYEQEQGEAPDACNWIWEMGQPGDLADYAELAS